MSHDGHKSPPPKLPRMDNPSNHIQRRVDSVFIFHRLAKLHT
jgi:hypothetical protein